MWINHKLVDFTNAANQQKVNPGCSADPEDEMVEEDSNRRDLVHDDASNNKNPCFKNPCKHGSKCIQRNSHDFVCKCLPGWAGKFCEHGNVFRKPLFFLDYYFKKKLTS